MTQSVLSSKLGKAVDSFKVRIDTSDAKVPFRNQLAQFGIVLLSGVTGLSRIGPTTYLITANLILTIIVLLVLCKTLVSLNSAAPVQVVITQSVPASIIVVPSATPTPIPVPTQTSSPSPTSTPSPSSTPTLTPTATATATPLPSSTPTPTSTFTRIVPTAAPTFESAVLLSDVSVATDRGARIILPAGTTVTILERNGCQVRMFLRDTSSRDSLQIYAWIDRTLIGESC